MDIFTVKMPNGSLMPAQESDRELLKHVKVGQVCRLQLSRVRNYQFHRKYFALLNLAFDYWEPPEHGKGSAWREKIPVEKNFERFRRDLIILAGYYEATFRLNGDIRIEARSISFGAMDEDEFEELYNATISVIVKHVLQNYSDDMLKSIMSEVDLFLAQVEEFDG